MNGIRRDPRMMLSDGSHVDVDDFSVCYVRESAEK
jgi:hypothetical protein